MDIRNGIRGLLNNIVKEDAGRKGAVFLKSLGIAETGTPVDEGVAYWRTGELVKLLTNGISDKASRRNKHDVDLPALSGTGHLLMGLGNILGMRQLAASDPVCARACKGRR